MNSEIVSVVSGTELVVVPEKERLPKPEIVDGDIAVPLAVPTSTKVLRSVFRRECGNLIFRRISTVVTQPADLVRTFIETPNEDGSIDRKEFAAGSPLPEFTKKEIDQNVGEEYTKFSFYTTKTSLRKNDRFGESQIRGLSRNYAELDLLTFKPSRDPAAKIITALPRKAELVCGIVALDHKQRPEFKTWFICSEQFFRFVSVILDDEYFLTIGTTPEEARRSIVCGNKFSTSGYHRWVRACTEHGVYSEHTELQSRFWTLRHEKISREYSHIYTWLAVLFCFHELPCPTASGASKNVPNNNDMGPKNKTWDLPLDFEKKFCTAYGIVRQPGTTTISRVVNTPDVPRGTRLVENVGMSLARVHTVPNLDEFPSLPSPSAAAAE